MNRVIIVGGSIAAVTAAGQLRAEGWDGDIVMLSDEDTAPYSRVPLSKGVLAGRQPIDSVFLAALPADVEVRLRSRAVALHTGRRAVQLAGGNELTYDGLVVATGARARRLAVRGQRGELLVRTLADAQAISERIADAASAVVVGTGFLGMEVASTLRSRGLTVTVVDREPPLRRLLGTWLADLIVAAAAEQGVRFWLAPDGVTLLGDPVCGVVAGPGQRICADVVVSAVGDLPNVEWLGTSGLRLAGGLLVDAHCRATPHVVAAGDVTVLETVPGTFVRSPHWNNAVGQARTAALNLLDPQAAPYRHDPYFWTEQFGLDLKIAGDLPLAGEPRVLAGNARARSALLQWHRNGEAVAAATLNHRLSIVKLKSLSGNGGSIP